MKSSNACLKSAATSALARPPTCFEVDHIIHKGGGGTEGSFNLTIVYRKCNDKKRSDDREVRISPSAGLPRRRIRVPQAGPRRERVWDGCRTGDIVVFVVLFLRTQRVLRFTRFSLFDSLLHAN